MQILVADNIRKSYNGKGVLKDISFSINRGEIFAILGQNGAGKTTTIRILSTLLRQDSGRVLLFGEEPFRSGNIGELRRKIGYVGQDSERSAYGRMTVEENLLFFGRLMGLTVKETRRQIHVFAEAFQFEHKLKEQFMKLSGGQKQTVVIIRALLHDPQLIFLDEPTKGLDPVRALEIRRYLKQYVRDNGKTLLLTSHILPDVEYLADRVAFLRDGQIEYIDTPDRACSLLGYSDILEITGKKEAVLTCLHDCPDHRLLSEGEGKVVIGTNNFFGVLDMFRGIEGFRFSHRKANLEDAYLYFTQSEQNGGI